ncbi:MAG: sigma-54-dependent Fis family transcriptional regulator [Labilithrix sp.]|nr:sigma-54-dependent Fis family transcriptional regulator [Labilithrix sp.]
MAKPRVLVVDDKLNFHALFRRLAGTELDLLTAANGEEALRLLARESVDVVVCDVKMPGMDGLAVLKQIKTLYPDVEVILMTAFAAVPDAVEALRAGAHHYLTKPFDPDDAMDAIRGALSRRGKAGNRGVPKGRKIVAASPAMRAVVDVVAQAAASRANVLITGEAGTGKKLVAAEIHARSARAPGPFVALDCDALTEEDLRAPFEAARAGTLLLANVTELSLPLQAKLLNALQRATVDVRVVAATTNDAATAVADGRLRQDLFYLLHVVAIHVPPLRERREDIVPLANEFLAAAPIDEGRVLRFSEDALTALNQYSWPGNVRQLENAVSRAAALTRGNEVLRTALPEEILEDGEPPEVDLATLTYREVLALSRDRMTREYLIAVLKAVKGNVTQAAERAGVERESVHRLLKRYGLRADDYRER